jgi:hypothetical protein
MAAFESLSALGHTQSNTPLDALDLKLIISNWRKTGVRNLHCWRPRWDPLIPATIHYSDRTLGNGRTRAMFHCLCQHDFRWMRVVQTCRQYSLASAWTDQRRGSRPQLDHTSEGQGSPLSREMDVGNICGMHSRFVFAVRAPDKSSNVSDSATGGEIHGIWSRKLGTDLKRLLSRREIWARSSAVACLVTCSAATRLDSAGPQLVVGNLMHYWLILLL